MLDHFLSLQIFLALARRGTFSAAAEEVGVSRAMASKHIQALERRLGVRLFNRTTRVTRLTEAGQQYFERAGDLLEQFEQLEAQLADAHRRISGNLTVAAPPSFGAFHLAPAVAAFMTQHPQIRIALRLTDRLIDLVEEQVDVAISVRELEDTSYIARHLAAVEMIVCASPDYLARHGAPQHPRDLADHNCLIFGDSLVHLHADWSFRQHDRDFDVRVRGDFAANVGNALRNVAGAGRGITRLPDYLVQDDLANGRLCALLQTFQPPLRPIVALYPHREHVPAKVHSFLDFVAEALNTSAPRSRSK